MLGTPPDIVGVGINSVDRVLVVPSLPTSARAASKIRVLREVTFCGGQTATALAACARFGLRTKYIGAVGNDVNGRWVHDELVARGVDVSALAIHEAVTRSAVILVDEATGERTVLWQFDPRLALTDADLPEHAIRNARLVHVDDVDVRAALSAASLARANGIPVTSDIDQVNQRTVEIIQAVTVAIFAEDVPLALAGRRPPAVERAPAPAPLDDLRDALSSIPRRHGQTLCVTLGDRGALALADDGFHHQPAFPVDAIDTTAAGDVFRAGFIFARLAGLALDEQLRWANAAAAVACTRLGAMASVPSREEVEKVLSAGC